QPTLVRGPTSTVTPATKERESEPANSMDGMVVLTCVPLVRTSVLMMKRLLCVPPADSGALSVTAPPPVKLNTSARKFWYVFSSPAASVTVASWFTPLPSQSEAWMVNADDVGLSSATYVWNVEPKAPGVLP